MATINCMHRFCRECIIKALRMGDKKCPACRTPCKSKRYLRADRRMDELIAVLFPDIEAFEAQEQKLLDELTSSARHTALQKSCELGLKRQAASTKFFRRKPIRIKQSRSKSKERPGANARDRTDRPTRKRKRPARAATGLTALGLSSGSSYSDKSGNETTRPSRKRRKPTTRAVGGGDPVGEAMKDARAFDLQCNIPRIVVDQDDIVAHIIRHPFEQERPSLYKCLIKTTGVFTVDQLCKFLALKLPGRIGQRNYKVSVDVIGQSYVLKRELTLAQVFNTYWRVASNGMEETPLMLLYYSLLKTPV